MTIQKVEKVESGWHTWLSVNAAWWLCYQLLGYGSALCVHWACSLPLRLHPLLESFNHSHAFTRSHLHKQIWLVRMSQPKYKATEAVSYSHSRIGPLLLQPVTVLYCPFIVWGHQGSKSFPPGGEFVAVIQDIVSIMSLVPGKRGFLFCIFFWSVRLLQDEWQWAPPTISIETSSRLSLGETRLPSIIPGSLRFENKGYDIINSCLSYDSQGHWLSLAFFQEMFLISHLWARDFLPVMLCWSENKRNVSNTTKNLLLQK